ncbi:MAG: cupin domain-containing protein [Rhodothermales bacterium]|nr:cupin domain-containing protein [Rhodothermales bacterium]
MNSGSSPGGRLLPGGVPVGPPLRPLDGRPLRSALTTTYFLLAEGQHSCWHRVCSDEAWHFYEGAPLDLFGAEADGTLHRDRLASGVPDARPTGVVPAGCWQAARPAGAYALVGCTVGPGFDFDYFELLAEGSPEAEQIRGLPGLPPELN